MRTRLRAFLMHIALLPASFAELVRCFIRPVPREWWVLWPFALVAWLLLPDFREQLVTIKGGKDGSSPRKNDTSHRRKARRL